MACGEKKMRVSGLEVCRNSSQRKKSDNVRKIHPEFLFYPSCLHNYTHHELMIFVKKKWIDTSWKIIITINFRTRVPFFTRLIVSGLFTEYRALKFAFIIQDATRKTKKIAPLCKKQFRKECIQTIVNYGNKNRLLFARPDLFPFSVLYPRARFKLIVGQKNAVTKLKIGNIRIIETS